VVHTVYLKYFKKNGEVFRLGLVMENKPDILGLKSKNWLSFIDAANASIVMFKLTVAAK